MNRPAARPRTVWVLAVALVALLGACTSYSSDDPSPTAASPTVDPCIALTSLQTSIVSLLAVQPVQVGVQGVKDAVSQVGTDISAAASATSEDLKPEVDALQQSVQTMADTIANAGEAGAAATASLLAQQLPAVGTAWSALTSAAADLDCNLTTPNA